MNSNGVFKIFLYIGGFDDNSPLSSVERYDPRSNKWDYVAALTTPRGGVGIATVMGKIFAVGGHNGNAYLNTVEAFDPVLNRYFLCFLYALMRSCHNRLLRALKCC